MSVDDLLSQITTNPSYRELAPHILLLMLWRADSNGEFSEAVPLSFEEDFFERVAWQVYNTSPALRDAFCKRLDIYKLDSGSLIAHQDYFRTIAQGLAEIPLEDGASRGAMVESLLQHLEDDVASEGVRSCPIELVQLLTSLARQCRWCRSIYDPHSETGRLLAGVVVGSGASAPADQMWGLGQSDSEAGTFHGLLRAFHQHDVLSFDKVDALKSPPSDRGDLRTFDAVISDLSNGADTWDQEHGAMDPFGRFRFGIPPRGKGELAFIQHMLATTKPSGGLTIAVVDQAVLSRSGKEADIRGEIIESNLLDTIIYLPPKLYRSDPRSLAIMIFRAERVSPSVLLIDGSKFYSSSKSLNTLTAPGIQRILENYSLRAPVEGETKLVRIADLRINEYALNLGRYFISRPHEDLVDLHALCNEREALQSELTEVSAEIDVLVSKLATD
jgi:hypothetical protein